MEPKRGVVRRGWRRLQVGWGAVYERGEIVLAGLRPTAADDEHVPQERKLAAALPEGCPQRSRRDDGASTAVRQQEALLIRRDREADESRHRANLDRAEEGGHELGPVGEEDGYALLDLDTQRGQSVPHLVHPVPQLAKCDLLLLVDVRHSVTVSRGDGPFDVLDGDVQHARHIDLRRGVHRLRSISGGGPSARAARAWRLGAGRRRSSRT